MAGKSSIPHHCERCLDEMSLYIQPTNSASSLRLDAI
jgi:hypothetical protein